MAPTLSDHDLIRDTIANVAISFDTNAFSQIRDSFTSHCVVDYPGSLGLMTGVDAVIQGIRRAISHIETHHALSTQSIRLTGRNTAEATTYCTAHHQLDERSLLALGRYEDKLERVSVQGVEKWLIKERTAVTMGKPVGDLSIFNLE